MDAADALALRAFPDHPDDYYYATATLRQRLDLLRHLIDFSDLLLLVTGPAGAGKSALLSHLLANAGVRWRVCEVAAAPGADADRLLEMMLAGFDLHDLPESREQRVVALEQHLEMLQHRDLVALFAIDDAHLLTPDAVRFVHEFAARFEGVRPRLLLLGEADGLQPPPAVADDRGTFAHLTEIAPFTDDDAIAYLQARLQRVGATSTMLDEAELARVVREAGGRPGALHALARARCRNALEGPASGKPRPVFLEWMGGGRRTRPLLVAAAAVVLLSAVLLRLVWSPDTDTTEPGMPAAATAATDAAAPADTASASTTAIGLPPSAAPEPSAPLPIDAGSPGAVLVPAPEVLETVAPPAIPAIVATTIAAEEDSVPPEATVGQPDPASGDNAVATLPASRPAETVVPVAPAPSAVAPAPAAATGTPEEGTLSWLRAQPSGSHTIQIMASSDRRAMERAIARHGIGRHTVVVRTRRDAGDWYVAVHGVFANRNAARAAIATLPAAVKKDGPWPRAIREVLAGAVP